MPVCILGPAGFGGGSSGAVRGSWSGARLGGATLPLEEMVAFGLAAAGSGVCALTVPAGWVACVLAAAAGSVARVLAAAAGSTCRPVGEVAAPAAAAGRAAEPAVAAAAGGAPAAGLPTEGSASDLVTSGCLVSTATTG